MTDGNNSGDDGRGIVDRRKFVAGLSALGVAGAAGCLGDDGGSTDTPTDTETPTPTDTTADTTTIDTSTTEPPTATGTPTDTETPTPTDTATPTPTPTGPEYEPVPADLVYQFFEGANSLSNLDSMAPSGSGEPDLLTTEGEDESGAFRFAGTLTIGGRLPAGEYEFTTGGNADNLRVFVGGNEVSLSGTTDLPEGTHDLRVLFLQEGSSDELSLGWRGTYGELMPRIAEADPIRQSEIQAGGQYEIGVGTRPNSKRMDMPGSGTGESQRSLAVGLPTYTNFCFDANNGNIPYAWQGAFLDYGPMVSYGGGRGDDPGVPLGEQFSLGGVAYPFRVGVPDTKPDFEYVAYRESPVFTLHYAIDGRPISQQVRGVPGEPGVEYTIKLDSAPSLAMFFLTAEDAPIEREASVGTWDGGTLQIAERITEFTVTIINTAVGQ